MVENAAVVPRAEGRGDGERTRARASRTAPALGLTSWSITAESPSATRVRVRAFVRARHARNAAEQRSPTHSNLRYSATGREDALKPFSGGLTLPRGNVLRCTRRPRHTGRSHLRLGTRARRTHCHWPHGARLIKDRERNRERADGVGHVDDARHSPLARTAREEQVHLPARRAVSRAARGMHAVCTLYARYMHAVCTRYAACCSAASTPAGRAACAWAWRFRYGTDPPVPPRSDRTPDGATPDARRSHGPQVQIRRRRAQPLQPQCRCGQR
jgi:hypothetical protein